MFIKVTNGTPKEYTIGQLRKDNPNVSFPKSIPEETLAAFSVYKVTPSSIPVVDEATQKVEQGLPVEQPDGSWVQQWNIVTKTTKEQQEAYAIAAASVRSKRNELLAASDWTQLADVSSTVSPLWATYRQLLRDITSQQGFPFSVEYPLEP